MRIILTILFIWNVASAQSYNGWRWATPASSNLLLDAGYEEANALNTQSPALLTPEYRSSSEEKNSTAPYVAFERQNSVTASGSWALLVRLDEDYPLDDRYRAERTFYNLETPIAEQWYRFKYFLPEDFEMEANIVQLAQFHSLDNEGDSDKIPALSFYINGDGDYDVNIAYSDEYVSSFPYPNVHYTSFDPPSDDFGSWVEIVIHARWDYREDIDGGDGLIEFWKDGVLEFTHNGPNCFFDDLGVYFKWGLMKLGSWVTTATEKVVYYDDIRVGTSAADYAEMTAAVWHKRNENIGMAVVWINHVLINQRRYDRY